MHRLIAEGRVLPAGQRAFDARDEKRAGAYSYENRPQRPAGRGAEAVQGAQGGVGVVAGADAVVPAHGDVVGGEREAGGDARSGGSRR